MWTGRMRNEEEGTWDRDNRRLSPHLRLQNSRWIQKVASKQATGFIRQTRPEGWWHRPRTSNRYLGKVLPLARSLVWWPPGGKFIEFLTCAKPCRGPRYQAQPFGGVTATPLTSGVAHRQPSRLRAWTPDPFPLSFLSAETQSQRTIASGETGAATKRPVTDDHEQSSELNALNKKNYFQPIPSEILSCWSITVGIWTLCCINEMNDYVRTKCVADTFRKPESVVNQWEW